VKSRDLQKFKGGWLVAENCGFGEQFELSNTLLAEILPRLVDWGKRYSASLRGDFQPGGNSPSVELLSNQLISIFICIGRSTQAARPPELSGDGILRIKAFPSLPEKDSCLVLRGCNRGQRVSSGITSAGNESIFFASSCRVTLLKSSRLVDLAVNVGEYVSCRHVRKSNKDKPHVNSC
jgi:hypothetical protein